MVTRKSFDSVRHQPWATLASPGWRPAWRRCPDRRVRQPGLPPGRGAIPAACNSASSHCTLAGGSSRMVRIRSITTLEERVPGAPRFQEPLQPRLAHRPPCPSQPSRSARQPGRPDRHMSTVVRVSSYPGAVHGEVRIRPRHGLKSFHCAARPFPALDALQLVEQSSPAGPDGAAPAGARQRDPRRGAGHKSRLQLAGLRPGVDAGPAPAQLARGRGARSRAWRSGHPADVQGDRRLASGSVRRHRAGAIAVTAAGSSARTGPTAAATGGASGSGSGRGGRSARSRRPRYWRNTGVVRNRRCSSSATSPRCSRLPRALSLLAPRMCSMPAWLTAGGRRPRPAPPGRRGRARPGAGTPGAARPRRHRAGGDQAQLVADQRQAQLLAILDQAQPEPRQYGPGQGARPVSRVGRGRAADRAPPTSGGRRRPRGAPPGMGRRRAVGSDAGAP
jgi:hypothetical protein